LIAISEKNELFTYLKSKNRFDTKSFPQFRQLDTLSKIID